MNLNIYEKTRYQNIYRHKKNKNYIVKINTPVDSTISIINGEKIAPAGGLFVTPEILEEIQEIVGIENAVFEK